MNYLPKISALAENHSMPNEKVHLFYHAVYFIPITKSFQGNTQDVTNKKHFTYVFPMSAPGINDIYNIQTDFLPTFQKLLSPSRF